MPLKRCGGLDTHLKLATLASTGTNRITKTLYLTGVVICDVKLSAFDLISQINCLDEFSFGVYKSSIFC